MSTTKKYETIGFCVEKSESTFELFETVGFCVLKYETVGFCVLSRLTCENRCVSRIAPERAVDASGNIQNEEPSHHGKQQHLVIHIVDYSTAKATQR